jgi:DNA-binding transcriptional regulator PaaX
MPRPDRPRHPAATGRPDNLSGMATTRQKKAATSDVNSDRWLLLIYKVPSDSSRARVAVWRELKRLGGFYVQQAVCVLPDREELRAGMAKVREKVSELGGSSVFLTLTDVGDDAQTQFVDGFRGQSAKEYAEIVEECETKFVKEIEFERFRENYTFEEAEEIRQDLEKLRRWLTKVEADVYERTEGKI